MAIVCQCSPKQPPIEWVKGKEIGSGSYGTVHLAMDNTNGALFVVKSAETEAGILALESESNVLVSLDSPYIVKCLGKDASCRANGVRKFSLLMEYMGGGSLADVVEKFGGALDERVICLYTREIILGLKYLHENGIVHCDLKCKNVLLSSLGNIKLADFGCAKRVKKPKNTQSCKWIGGTPLWMAPEVLRNERLDFSADIWSLGCTVIEMATGKPPNWGIDASNPVAAILKIALSDKVPKFPTRLSQEGLDFLSKCLERDPLKRWTANELLDHPFVLGKRDNGEQNASSPASVLDIGMFECCYDSDDDSSADELESKIPFSRRQKGNSFPRHQHDDELDSSDTWITVRTT